jgi:hypothetical protein
LHRAKEKAQSECGWKGGDSSRANQVLGGHRVQAEMQDTNWRWGMLTFLPSRTIAAPSSPSRVRCAAPNTRRALDCSGRLCKIFPLGRKVNLRKATTKTKVQNQNLLDTYRHSHGRPLHKLAPSLHPRVKDPGSGGSSRRCFEGSLRDVSCAGLLRGRCGLRARPAISMRRSRLRSLLVMLIRIELDRAGSRCREVFRVVL